MPTKKQSVTSDAVVEMPEGAGSVDQIRDILFGPQIREMERSLVRLEERLGKEVADLRGDFKQRLDALETFAREEIDAVGQSLDDERKARTAALDDLRRELGNLAKDTDRRMTKLDEQARKAHKDLRKLILDQSKSLGDEMQTKHDSLSDTMKRGVSELRADKADREVLAALFTELALRIKGEPLLPGSE
jgi:uncharacterized protein (DUF3084 family)